MYEENEAITVYSLPQPPSSLAEIEPSPDSSTGSLLNNHQIQKMTLAFFQAEKPAKTEPIDIALVIYLLQRRAIDHAVWDSQLTLSGQLCCSVDHIQRSLKRVSRFGWIVRSKRHGHSDGLTVVLDKLPQGTATRIQVTTAAKKLALQYRDAVTKKWRRKLPKGWLTQQFVSAQRILNRTNNDWNLAVRVISHAFQTPPFAAMTKKSLYHLCKPWDRIVTSYEASRQKGELVQ